MKTTFNVIGSVFALGAAILAVLHLVMLYGLTKAMRDVVLPRVKAETGIDARVGRLSINLARGHLFLKEVELRNPDGFLLENLASAERISIEVDMLSLVAQKPLRIKRVELEHALVNVVRNREGELNLAYLQAGLPEPTLPPSTETRLPETVPSRPSTIPSAPPAEQPPEPLPEVLIEALAGQATVRYLDMTFTQLDLLLDLTVEGRGLSTQAGPEVPWGSLSLHGALGSDRTRFITDLQLALAPVTDPQSLSFDLSGRMMEIDPRIMAKAYSRMGIRSAPFGLEPVFHCRANAFTHSAFALNVRDIQLEDKLSRRLGGVGSIGSLRFVVPVEGTLDEPEVDVASVLFAALGNNARSLLDAILQGSAGTDGVLKDLAGAPPSATNAPPTTSSDALVELLGEHVKEIGEDEALKDDLKKLGRQLFGR